MHDTIMNTTPEELLKEKFGYDEFRPHQREIIENVLNNNDTLVLMPTGGGKSMCYQIPALIMEGVCIVVSPLIALMKDQVMALKANGIGAAALNSTVSWKDANTIIEACRSEKTKLLYLSPEKLIAEISSLTKKIKISFIAVDEAHCISSWGHDFRPEYNQLHKLREMFPNIPLMALTATADKVTRKDIIAQLQLKDPKIFIASFNRPNIHLAVKSALTGKNKTDEIVHFLYKHREESGIIYCMSRKSTESLTEKLRMEGFSVAYYHAGMENVDRDRVQEDFINDRKKIICATIAFGMGIDKSNVRWVIHYNLPKNMEGYYQEIGRAGRDGEKAEALLFYNVGDLIFLTEIAQKSGQAELNMAKLNRIQQFAEAPNCRRIFLLGYFGEALQENCNKCDVCKDPRPLIDGTRIAQMALSASTRTNERAGINMLIDILRGSSKSDVFEHGFHKIKTYGAGKEFSFQNWQYYLLQLLNLGVFEIAYDEHFALKITDYGRAILNGRATIQLGEAEKMIRLERSTRSNYRDRLHSLEHELELRQQERNLKKRFERFERDSETDSQLDNEMLFQDLREMRTGIAKALHTPAYVIFSDAVLRRLSERRPTEPEELQDIPGMGENKIKNFGLSVINRIRQFEMLPPYTGDFFVKEIKINQEKKKAKGSTYLETLRLYNEGKRTEAIAKERGLHPNTIMSHLSILFERGEMIDPYEFVSQEIIEKVKAVTKGDPKEIKELTPLFTALGEKVPFDMIRMALAVIRKMS